MAQPEPSDAFLLQVFRK